MKKLTYSLEISTRGGICMVRMRAQYGKNPPILLNWIEFKGLESIQALEDEARKRLGISQSVENVSTSGKDEAR